MKSPEVDAYIATFPKGVQVLLNKVRRTIRAASPKAVDAGPKGNLRFPYGQPVPLALIARIVRLKVKQNVARTAAKKPVARSKK